MEKRVNNGKVHYKSRKVYYKWRFIAGKIIVPWCHGSGTVTTYHNPMWWIRVGCLLDYEF